MTEPNKDNLRKWVAALRSGEFTQGMGCLKDVYGKMCCLGVASEVYRRETGKGRWDEGENDNKDWFIVTDGNGDEEFPVPEVQAWLGITSKNPYLDCKIPRHEDMDEDDEDQEFTETELQASELNDYYEWNFEQIAAAVVETYQL